MPTSTCPQRERHSHGLRRLVATQASRGSFDEATTAVRATTGTAFGKRQAEEPTRLAAVDFDAFYQSWARPAAGPEDVLVLWSDGNGIVMLADALHAATARAAAKTNPKLATRLSKREKRNRKRLAEVGAVYHITPVPRTAGDVLANHEHEHVPGPCAKWLTASVVHDTGEVISTVFDEAERRDPAHARTWVGLVDGNNHQIDRIHAEAKQRGVSVHVLVDFVHVLEYLWRAADTNEPTPPNHAHPSTA
jgi:hypothetical protein